MNNNRRYSSNTQENCLLEFLDKYVYSKLYASHKFTGSMCFAIPQSPETHLIMGQLSKSTINHPKDSFSFEILSENAPGWFIAPDNANVYVFAFVRQAKVNSYGYMTSADDIEELELLFVDKQDLKAHINQSIYDDAMYQTAIKMCKENTRSIFVSHDMYLYHSESASKKNVHLIIQKYALDDLAFAHLVATKTSIQSAR